MSTLAEIYVLKPQRMELDVETAEPIPDFAPEHQKRSGRLLDLGWSGGIEIQATIAPVDRIFGKNAIQAEHLVCQSERGRKAPDVKATLHGARTVEQLPCSEPGARLQTSFDQRGDGCS